MKNKEIMLKRNVLKSLIEWKNSETRKPLILQGARQVGKTWIMKRFGKENYEKVFYFNFDTDSSLNEKFEKNKNAKTLIKLLGLSVGEKIEPKKHLIIFDEIQFSSAALNSLKYFNENAKDFHIICAGSLLGVFLAKPQSAPVGQIDMIEMFPLSFSEFLENVDEKLFYSQNELLKMISSQEIVEIPQTELDHLTLRYKEYLLVGGMPESVHSWIVSQDISKVKSIQKNLLSGYENDIAKHAGSEIDTAKVLLIYKNIVPQLSKDNKKFIYSKVQSGKRARDFEDAITWLENSGLVYKVPQNNAPAEYPLKSNNDFNNFKLYFFDTGLLLQLAEIEPKRIVESTPFSFSGAIAENFVLQQLKTEFGLNPSYYSPDSSNEVDFLIQYDGQIFPIEVKAGSNLTAKSLQRYIQKFKPNFAIRFSMHKLETSTKILEIPHYLINKSLQLLQEQQVLLFHKH